MGSGLCWAGYVIVLSIAAGIDDVAVVVEGIINTCRTVGRYNGFGKVGSMNDVIAESEEKNEFIVVSHSVRFVGIVIYCSSIC